MQDFPDKSPPAFLRPFGSKRQSRAKAAPRLAGDSKHRSCVPWFFQSLRFVKAAKPSGKRQSRADLGVLGKLYPAVNGRWDTNADNLSLTDMKPKVNYKAGDDILASRW